MQLSDPEADSPLLAQLRERFPHAVARFADNISVETVAQLHSISKATSSRRINAELPRFAKSTAWNLKPRPD